jgi:hypothetical protein
MITQRTVMAIKVEAAEGTKETLANTDVFLAFSPAFEPDIEMHERDPVRETLSGYPSVSGKRSARMTFDYELVSTGAAGTALAAISALMKGCGFGETVNAANWVKYVPASSAISSVTIAQYHDSAMIKRMWGARGNVKFTWEAGKPPIAHFDFLGADFEVVDGAFPGSITSLFPAGIPPACLATTFTVDAYAALISKVELDMGNKLAKRIDMNSSSGVKSIALAGRKPKGSFDPEDVLVATYDIFGKWQTPGTLGALSMTVGGTAGSRLAISLPKVRHTKVGQADRDGQRYNNVEFEATLSAAAGDDEVSLLMY